MRSFAVIAGLAAVAVAAPHYENAYPAAPAGSVTASSAAPAGTPSGTPPAGYPSYPEVTPSASASHSAPGYGASSPSAAQSSSAPAHVASSSAPVYATTTEVISATTYECPKPTTITHGPSTYIITSSTVLSIPHYTATYVHSASPTPVAPAPTASKPAYTPVVPEASVTKPAYTPVVPEASVTKPGYTPAVPEPSVTKPAYSAAPPAPHYPSSNATMPNPPVGTATGIVPSATKPTNPPQFTGAAGKATVGFFAIAGAVAAFL
ncbi:hypothetical protein CFE70_000896 [Pyrenophora teres f. teres 0-1]|uniref:Uncharacterized protein n=1 Tax=Pyrenophora teres f. teres (strain 0-1) TaxID=861557 RepID=E3RYP1_PYRTT|nr:hypothetical protein PTT_14682 [Pyrenophora teres f. teres 0-1]KAE8824427.1 hypothetical protein HRS9122_10361 [Pyrenophora teres f. teres]CAA9957331.1 hypothetical protein PTMSG1_00939 [Pyrenophora teres f. maculata]KAE8835822.1 hypothetical protein HRS9139_03920 [Pyrenophora teres f. teres]KAE8838205.1 hypothetical protein PTNB85_05540 [Pyrenophora teres f. teres]